MDEAALRKEIEEVQKQLAAAEAKERKGQPHNEARVEDVVVAEAYAEPVHAVAVSRIQASVRGRQSRRDPCSSKAPSAPPYIGASCTTPLAPKAVVPERRAPARKSMCSLLTAMVLGPHSAKKLCAAAERTRHGRRLRANTAA